MPNMVKEVVYIHKEVNSLINVF